MSIFSLFFLRSAQARLKNRHRGELAALLILDLLTATLVPCRADAPTRFVSRGVGGGGSFFGPSINPYAPSEVWVGSDMGDLFYSSDFGGAWETVDFRFLQGGSLPGRMEFTGNPLVRYALNGDVPARSFDGGISWTNIPPDIWSPSVYCLFADPFSTNRLLVSDYTTLKISTNCGASYVDCFTTNDFHIAGVFWDGPKIYVGTRLGLLISTNGGAGFTLAGMPGVAAGEEIVSFAGARENGVLRFFCVTFPAGSVWPGIQGSEYGSYRNIYRLDGGSGSWTVVTNGVADHHPVFVAMCRTNINIAYIAGSDNSGQPLVLKTINGGGSWSSVMNCTGNANVITGWSGYDSGSWNWKQWSFGECAMGFTVCPSDPNRAVISDFGFIHVTTNGGVSWQQAYDMQSCQNLAGSETPKTTFYTGCGAEDTSCWWLTWFSSNTVFCSFTDIRGMLSTNGGNSWMTPMSLNYNSSYQTLKHPTNGLVYAAVSSVHDMYAWDRYCQDSAIDGGTGEVKYSADQGATWATLKNFGKPVVSLALDPVRPTRLYAAVVNSASGGIYRTVNLNAGSSATWSKLAVPPRTQGHPFNIHVLNDGTLVAAYSARIASNDFQPSSGVFVSVDDGASWIDRTDSRMLRYTKDLTVDSNDPSQKTWYAGVWGEWGSSSGLGGLYCTTNRGITWTCLTTNLKAVSSATLNPANTNELYVTTEDQGLWFSTNRLASSPNFTQLNGYPFRFPTRVFFNPYSSNEVWVTSFGNGMRLGRMIEPSPVLSRLTRTGTMSSITVNAAPGQTVVLSSSSDLKTWNPVSTNTLYSGQAVVKVPATPSIQFYRGRVR